MHTYYKAANDDDIGCKLQSSVEISIHQMSSGTFRMDNFGGALGILESGCFPMELSLMLQFPGMDSVTARDNKLIRLHRRNNDSYNCLYIPTTV